MPRYPYYHIADDGPGDYDDGRLYVNGGPDVHVYPDLNCAADIVDHATRRFDHKRGVVKHYPCIEHDDLLAACADYYHAPRINLHIHPERADNLDKLASAVHDAARRLVDNATDVASNRPE